MTTANNWYVITGGPSTGKSTLLDELAKLGYKTVPEAAREEIDVAVAKGIAVEDLREDEKRFQEDVVKRRVNVEAKLDSNEITFLDRGMPDSLAYLRFYKYDIAPWIMELVEKHKYRKVFLMDNLPVFKKDYARTEVAEFNDYIEDLLLEAYKEYGMEPVIIPPVSIEERVKLLLEYLKADQKG